MSSLFLSPHLFLPLFPFPSWLYSLKTERFPVHNLIFCIRNIYIYFFLCLRFHLVFIKRSSNKHATCRQQSREGSVSRSCLLRHVGYLSFLGTHATETHCQHCLHRTFYYLCCHLSVCGLKWLFYVQVSAMIPCQSILGKNASDLPLHEPSQGCVLFFWQRSLILFQEKLCGRTKCAAYCCSNISSERKNVCLVLYSTYLFIPCPQSNPKKCYAKELKGKRKEEKYQNRNYKFRD